MIMKFLKTLFNKVPKETIFVQIASYRDPELKPTLKSLLENADQPENLKVCIAWQHSEEDEWDELDEYQNNPNFKILDIDYKETTGVCWARNQVQQHYNNETYTLQLDSHHRFAPGWDSSLKKMVKDLQADGHEKPLISAYIPSYDPDDDPNGRVHTPWYMGFDKFTPEGIVFFLPAFMDNHKKLTKPVPARFYSAHFAFSIGKFAKEVQHDPQFYFHGEEISITVRAYTHGYDLFHPHKVVAWHEYTRKGRTKQWDDDEQWHVRNTFTHQRTRTLLGIDTGVACTPCQKKQYGKYYLGDKRTIRDYEEYAGIHFKTRSVCEYTMGIVSHGEHYPPNPKVENFESQFLKEYEYKIEVNKKDLKRKRKFGFWAIILKNKKGDDIYRKDLVEDVLDHLLEKHKGKDKIVIKGKYTGKDWDEWVVWPHSGTEWLEAIHGKKEKFL